MGAAACKLQSRSSTAGARCCFQNQVPGGVGREFRPSASPVSSFKTVSRARALGYQAKAGHFGKHRAFRLDLEGFYSPCFRYPPLIFFLASPHGTLSK